VQVDAGAEPGADGPAKPGAGTAGAAGSVEGRKPEPDEPPPPPGVAPDEFYVHIAAHPPGARVMHRGKELGRAPYDVTWKKTHKPPTVRIEADGYDPYEIKVQLTDAGTELRVELNKSEATPAPAPTPPPRTPPKKGKRDK
jgi:hypothetical protein